MREEAIVKAAFDGPAWVMDGNYAFICHAGDDKVVIDRLGLVRLLTRDAVRLVIDKDTALDVGDLPHLVHTFRGGREWETEIEELADRAGCVLILWSASMKARVAREERGGWIGYEILTGLRNGTAFFCSLDGEPSPDDICTTLSNKLDGFERFKIAITSQQIIPLGRKTSEGQRQRNQLDNDMSRLARDVYRKINSRISSRRATTLEQTQINRLLDLLDREEAVERIVHGQGGVVHVISGQHPECRRDDLIQRLKDIELPWLLKNNDNGYVSLLAWRASVVRGADAKTWVPCCVPWPTMDGQASTHDEIEAAARDGVAAFFRRLSEYMGVILSTRSEDEAVAALAKRVKTSADAYLVISAIDERSAASAQNLRFIEHIGAALQAMPTEKLRLILFVQKKKPNKWLFFKRSNRLEEVAARRKMFIELGAVRRDDLQHWATLAEAIVDRPFNIIMESVNSIFARAAPRGGERGLPMSELREALQSFASKWPRRVQPYQSATALWSEEKGERSHVQSLST